MFFIDRKNAGRLREESDPSRWHTAFIWWPRFVLVSTTGHEPFWQFVGIGKTIRRSIGSELIGSWKIHRWVYQTDVSFAH